MSRILIAFYALAVLSGCAPAPVPAQPSPKPTAQLPSDSATVARLQATDPGALQTVALFEHACFPNIGDPVRLRTQAALLGAQAVPAAMTADFLKGHPGMAFNISSPEGKRVLVSFDNGLCNVMAPTIDADAIQIVILHDVIQNGGIPKYLWVGKNVQRGEKILSITFLYQGIYPIVTFISTTPPASSDAGRQIAIIGGNVNIQMALHS